MGEPSASCAAGCSVFSTQACRPTTMAQLTTAGGLSSTLLAPEPMRFTRTGAGAPHCSCFMGSETSTSAAMGASSRTHSRRAAITWASDHTSGLGGSACAASGGLDAGWQAAAGSSPARAARWTRSCATARARASRPLGCGRARWLLGGALLRLGWRLALHPRPARGQLEGRVRRRAPPRSAPAWRAPSRSARSPAGARLRRRPKPRRAAGRAALPAPARRLSRACSTRRRPTWRGTRMTSQHTPCSPGYPAAR